MEAPTPKARATGRCAEHSRYTGNGAPRCSCPVCWGMYLEAHYGLKIEEVLAPQVVKMNDAAAVTCFIDGLKSALAKAKDTGGAYSAFAHPKEGLSFQVEVQVPTRHV